MLIALLAAAQIIATPDATNPLTAWTSGFAPGMTQTAPKLTDDKEKDQVCKPTIITPTQQKGVSLTPSDTCADAKKIVPADKEPPKDQLDGQQTLKN